MAKAQTFRFSNTSVSAPTETGVVEVYIDQSGVLKSINSNSLVRVVGQQFPFILSGNYPGGVGYNVTGLAAVTGYLGVTKNFFVVQGPSGASVAVPFYPIV